MKKKVKEKKIKTVLKPWGKEVWIAHTRKYLGKILYINKGGRLSLQYHKYKHETLYCASGSCMVEIDGKKKLFRKGRAIDIPPGTVHRIYAKFGNVKIFEVSTPHPEDVVRISDDYGRGK